MGQFGMLSGINAKVLWDRLTTAEKEREGRLPF